MTNATAMLSALGDPTRQAILDKLTHGPLAVGQLADVLPVSRPAVSQHLKVLKEVGLVTDRQEGTRRLYQADPEALAVLRAYLDAFWERSLAAFQDRTAKDRTAKDRAATDRTAKDRAATDQTAKDQTAKNQTGESP
ncbi:metalloregulator ArsR/SmtB family transcription factor [Actinoplanes sp. NPDC051411]|uniref:ArsR/SmtB family transcription factor n=1 Tax=Actinoplanes sp. NPDC051411 TaxID=3155522 RepID=UPI003440ADC1